MQIESLLGDLDTPGPVGPFLGEHEAVAFVEFACRIQAREGGEENVAVPCVAAKIQRNAHEPLAESRPAVSVGDDEKTQLGGARRARAIDGDPTDDFIVLGGDPEAVSGRIEARKKLPKLTRNLPFEVGPETPLARIVAACSSTMRPMLPGTYPQICIRRSQAVSENSSRPISQRRISEVPAPIS
jgi:hypothetical protein